MKITNTKIYGLEESIVASGYPLSIGEPEYSLDRAMKLANVKIGSGHDCFLKGIIVQADICAPSYWWPQFQRYHFADIISSQSKMHNILKFNLEKQCNEYVDEKIVEILKEKIAAYNLNKTNENFAVVLSNVPMGLNLTARITTNYLQLKTIYPQRKSHKLPEWKYVCDWINSLEMSYLIVGKTK